MGVQSQKDEQRCFECTTKIKKKCYIKDVQLLLEYKERMSPDGANGAKILNSFETVILRISKMGIFPYAQTESDESF